MHLEFLCDYEKKTSFNSKNIQQLLAQSWPFLMVDNIIIDNLRKEAHGEKEFMPFYNEGNKSSAVSLFQLIETMGQYAECMIRECENIIGGYLLLAQVKKIRLYSELTLDKKYQIMCHLLYKTGKFYDSEIVISYQDNVVAEGELVHSVS